LPVLTLALLLLVWLEIARVGVLQGVGGVVLAVVSPVLVAVRRTGPVTWICGLLLAEAVLDAEVDLLSLLEGLFVLILVAGSVGTPVSATLHHRFRTNSAAWLIAFFVAWGKILGGAVIVEERVVEGGTFVGRGGGGSVVLGRASVGGVPRGIAVEVFALRVDVILEASFAGFEHSYR
jgi:hypothetical protein